MFLVSLALAADPFARDAQPCGGTDGRPITPPPGHVIVVGSGFTREEAWENVLKNAVQAQGARGNDARKAAIREAVRPWCVTEIPRGLRKETTFQGAIDGTWLGKLDAEMADLSRQLDELAKTVLTTAQQRELVFAPTAWDSGCVDDLGRYLNNELRRRLGAYGGVGFANSGPRDDKHAFLQLRAAALGDRVTISAAMELGTDRRLLPGLAFSLDLFGMGDDEGGTCATNQTLALAADTVEGAGGLRVSIDTGVEDGVACEGDRHHLLVRASRQADVHVFSVDRAGRGYHVFAGRAQAGAPLDLGEVEMVPVPGGGDERLVVVGYAPGVEAGVLGATRGLCALPSPFTASLAPRGAAIGTATFTVYGSGVDECPIVATHDASQKLVDAPPCW